MGIFKRFFSDSLFQEKKATSPPVLQVHLTLPKVPLGDIQRELNVVANKYCTADDSTAGDDEITKISSTETRRHDESLVNLQEEDLRRQASELFYKESKPELTALLGSKERGELRQYYFECFQFKAMGILQSLRQVCDKLYMRAESQHLDRLIDSFSKRWVECNPNHIYKSASHVYTLSYSIILLNTDMCCSDDRDRMTRTKYVQSTFMAIKTLSRDSDKEWQDKIITLLKKFYTSLQDTPLRLAGNQPAKQEGIQRRVSIKSIRDRSTRALADSDASSLFSKISQGSSWYQKSSYSQSLESGPAGGASVGFSSALWDAVIREEYANSDTADTDLSYDDDCTIEEYNGGVSALELLGPPWAKEGLLKFLVDSRKGRKRMPKDQVFVVVQRGYLKVFRFGKAASSSRNYNRSMSLGSGNWMQNATLVFNVALLHTTANLTTNTCFSLNLTNGCFLAFQAGTIDIAKEYVYTCNYWASRVSLALPEELVTSSEYGWERPLESYDFKNPPKRKLVSSINHSTVTYNGSQIVLTDWAPPVVSTVKSTLDEESQLRSFQHHLKSIEEQLVEHNKLKQPLGHVYPTYAPATLKVMRNWQKKSAYLSKEVAKFKIYIDVLNKAISDGHQYQNLNQ